MSFITKEFYCSPEVMRYTLSWQVRANIRDRCGFIGMLRYHLLIDAAIAWSHPLDNSTAVYEHTCTLCICLRLEGTKTTRVVSDPCLDQHMFTSAVSFIVCQIYVILYIDFRLSMLKSMDLSPSVSYEMYVSLVICS